MTDISKDKKKDNRFVPRNKYVSAAIKKTVGDFCSESSYKLIDELKDDEIPKPTDSLYAIKPIRLSLELLQLMINTKQLGIVDDEYLNFGDFPSISVEVNNEYSNSDQQWKKHKIYKDKGEKNCADKLQGADYIEKIKYQLNNLLSDVTDNVAEVLKCKLKEKYLQDTREKIKP